METDLFETAREIADRVSGLPIHQALAALEMARVSIEAELIDRRGDRAAT